jgi:hypothetical protein
MQRAARETTERVSVQEANETPLTLDTSGPFVFDPEEVIFHDAMPGTAQQLKVNVTNRTAVRQHIKVGPLLVASGSTCADEATRSR